MSSGTTTRAAAKLTISQPGVSRHIAELEGHLGFKLFNRIKGRLEPTDAAVQFVRIIEQNFLGLERIEHAAEKIRENVTQPVSIACLPALSTSLLPLVVDRIKRNNRTWSLLVDTGTVSEIIEKLQNHTADLALTLSFPPILGIEAEPLFTVEHVCAVPKDHYLAQKDCVCAADFCDEAVIGWSPAGPLAFEREAAVFADYVPQKNIRVMTHTSHTRYAMVAAGIGITIAEPFSAGPWLNNGVTILPFKPKLELSYSLCYPTGRIRSEAVDVLRTAILLAAREWQLKVGSAVSLNLE